LRFRRFDRLYLRLRAGLAMALDYILGGIVTLILVVYLVTVLIRPERF
jgi:K+-transporting ATPase KdpF subunit